MSASLGPILLAVAILAVLDAALVIAVSAEKRHRRRAYKRDQGLHEALRKALSARDRAALARLADARPRAFAAAARRLAEQCREDADAAQALSEALRRPKVARAVMADAASAFRHRRIRAYLSLGLAGGPEAAAALAARLGSEREVLCLRILLAQIAAMGPLAEIEALEGALARWPGGAGPAEYRILEPLAQRFAERYRGVDLRTAGEVAARLFLVGLRSKPDEESWRRAAALAEGRGGPADEAAAALAAAYPGSRFEAAFGLRREPRFMVPLASILGGTLAPEGLARLDPWFEAEAPAEVRSAGEAAVAELARRHPEERAAFLSALAEAPEPKASSLARALEFKLDYFMHREGSEPSPGLARMLRLLVSSGRPSAVLRALEGLKAGGLADAAAALLAAELRTRPEAAAFFSRHASQATLTALGLGAAPPEPDKPRIPVSKRDKLFIAALVVLALAAFPIFFAIRQGPALAYLSRPELLYRFIFDFHFLFAWYTIAVNGVYLALLGLSAAKLLAQSRLWESGLRRFLFSSGLLPSVSVIAPAYNEERTIVDSVASLLSLAYPRVEVIVVNDGSKDGTLTALSRGFSLMPAGTGAAGGGAGALPCMPVRTVYRSPDAPGLVVIDKANGGKADALNAGLNHASGEYVCCIDADSLLDPQALLRAMAQVLASRREVVAMGGNIFPVNGSEVEHGHLQKIGLPKNPLAAFQTMEYLRSFVSGRLGWALLDGLLIISGAFGLFRRGRVMEAGGYMTGSGRYRKDTVGEDMELVVRLTRAEREAGRRGKVDYCYNANCWTEVPEDGRTLYRQRDRWHRGLIEVLLQHRDMALRPRYGPAGLLGMPYFFAFELVGPWLELSGYVVFVASLLLSLIDPFVSLAVFSLALFFGILISLSSLLLAERQVVYFRPKEFAGLIGLSFLENLGFRQIMSMSRAWAFAQFFFKSKGWQKGERRGFTRSGTGHA